MYYQRPVPEPQHCLGDEHVAWHSFYRRATGAQLKCDTREATQDLVGTDLAQFKNNSCESGDVISIILSCDGLLSSSYHMYQVSKKKKKKSHKCEKCHIPWSVCTFPIKIILPDVTNFFPQRASVAFPLSNTFHESNMGPKGRNKETKIMKRPIQVIYPSDFHKVQNKGLICH